MMRFSVPPLGSFHLVSELRFITTARSIRETDAAAPEIALEVGYKNPSHFSRVFKALPATARANTFTTTDCFRQSPGNISQF
jgi:transcriptional regulator GlxA family with amidase domain